MQGPRRRRDGRRATTVAVAVGPDSGLPVRRRVAPGRASRHGRGSTADGNPLIIWTCNNGDVGQKWKVPADAPRGRRVVSRVTTASAAEVAGRATAAGTVIRLNACGSGTQQVWTAASDGTLRALGKCVTVAGAATATVRRCSCRHARVRRRRSGRRRRTVRWSRRRRASVWTRPATAPPTTPGSRSGPAPPAPTSSGPSWSDLYLHRLRARRETLPPGPKSCCRPDPRLMTLRCHAEMCRPPRRQPARGRGVSAGVPPGSPARAAAALSIPPAGPGAEGAKHR